MIEIIEKHYRNARDQYVKRLSFRAGSHEAAEDIVQEAYLRALLYQKSFHMGTPFNRWFNRIVNNCLRDYKREERGGPMEFIEEEAEGFNCTGVTRRMLDEIRQEIEEKTSDLEKETLTLYFLNGYKIGDIVRIMDTKYKATENIIQRFRRKLKDKYQ